ncbi:MAG: DUF2071 domain-containing protein [Bacteroidetes bacterium]|nr:DUF2071 domain-containing protein [Bacteroidota bacterium]
MNFLKSLSIGYTGELYNIKLINFSVEMDEVRYKVPTGLKIKDFNGRALISMVVVNLNRICPTFLNGLLPISYQHIAFRLLLDDSMYNEGKEKGVYFLKSFTDNKLVLSVGNLISHYNYTKARILDNENSFTLYSGKDHLHYTIGQQSNADKWGILKPAIQAIDRAYSVVKDQINVTRIMRHSWPLEPIEVVEFETSFFKTATFEAGFKVPGVIPYEWLPPKPVMNTRSELGSIRNFRI